ncbi:LysM peptidoglycan-binding domain-containing protein [Streptomyces scabiei]|uniref:LysM peptidoglycan-binding domain-containing protein n=1 Tax=Streptomyces scabiei TaxID=1930 RepID=UPI00379999B1
MSGAAELIRVAKAEVGYKEGFSNGHWNNKEKYADQVPGMAWVSAGGYPWCALFVSWAALKSGNTDLFPRSASCAYGVGWFKDKGRFSEYPAIGGQVFFGPNGGSHTGICVAYDSDSIWSVEGNTNTNNSPEGDGVYLRKHARRDAHVYGYGLPAFPEGVTTADPALKGKAGYHYAAKADGSASKPKAPTGLKKVVVKSGMTLTSIAVAAGVTLASLLTANPGIKDPNVIKPGQTITVPAKPSPTHKATPKATPKASPKPTHKASAKPSPKPSSTKSCK